LHELNLLFTQCSKHFQNQQAATAIYGSSSGVLATETKNFSFLPFTSLNTKAFLISPKGNARAARFSFAGMNGALTTFQLDSSFREVPETFQAFFSRLFPFSSFKRSTSILQPF
jgi:hypothetical protein